MSGFRCLYECGSGAASTDEYHVYSRSASTLELTLPPGIVCDACNNYFSQLENHFTQHHPGSSARIFHIDRTRKGKPPKFNHAAGAIECVDDAGLRNMTTKLDPGAMRVEFDPNGDLHFVSSITPHGFDAAIVSRVIHKIAFEGLLFFRDKPELNPTDPRFAPMRDYIRRPASGQTFQPFAWRKLLQSQQQPYILTASDNATGKAVDFCVVTLPDTEYVIPLPPWPIPEEFWKALGDHTIVSQPGHVALDPQEVRLTLRQSPEDEARPR